MQFRRVLDGVGFLEGIRWHDGRVWASDISRRRVLAVRCDGELEVAAQLNDSPSGLGFLNDRSTCCRHDAHQSHRMH